MNTLREILKKENCEIRHFSEPLNSTESFENVISVFDFSSEHKSIDGFKYYNDYYIIKK